MGFKIFSKVFRKSAVFVQYLSKIGKYTLISFKMEIVSCISAEVSKKLDYDFLC
jgi:hypothetical protein